jgi:Kef-type K+ transport system membrane component KefB
MPENAKYLILIITVLIIPKLLLRFRMPSGLTALALGVATTFFLGWFQTSQTVEILATLGITSLFLFAGLEVEVEEFKKNAPILLKHISIAAGVVGISTYGLHTFTELDFRASAVLALGLTTPSTGFILNALNSFKFDDKQKYWIRTKAIAIEVLALILLFFALQSQSVLELGMSLSTLIVLILLIPLTFRFFLKIIAPFAPDSEVTFMILVAFVSGVITKELGTYYLIGAFIVGVVAAQFRHFIHTENSEKMLYSISFFSSLFIPFYFFKSGLRIDTSALGWSSLIYGIVFLVVFVPVRYLSTFLSVHFFLKECWSSRYEISMSLMPTLIFGLVMASILQVKFQAPNEIVNGLIIYTVLSSIIPAVVLKSAPPEEYDFSTLNAKGKRL